MTTTAIINGASVGTGSNIGSFVSPTETALQAATTALKISAQITLGVLTDGNNSSVIKVWHAWSPINYPSAIAGVQALAQGAEYVQIRLNSNLSGVLEKGSELLITAGGYHYCWIEMPKLTTAATIIVNLIELP